MGGLHFEFVSELSKESWIDKFEFLKFHPSQVEKHFTALPSFVDENGEVVFDSITDANHNRRISICRFQVENLDYWGCLSFEPTTDLPNYLLCFLLPPEQIVSWANIFNLLIKQNLTDYIQIDLEKLSVLELIQISKKKCQPINHLND